MRYPVKEPISGLEPLTYALRMRRTTDCAISATKTFYYESFEKSSKISKKISFFFRTRKKRRVAFDFCNKYDRIRQKTHGKNKKKQIPKMKICFFYVIFHVLLL